MILVFPVYVAVVMRFLVSIVLCCKELCIMCCFAGLFAESSLSDIEELSFSCVVSSYLKVCLLLID